MKLAITVMPWASILAPAAPLCASPAPTETILPSFTTTAPRSMTLPVPSMMWALLITRFWAAAPVAAARPMARAAQPARIPCFDDKARSPRLFYRPPILEKAGDGEPDRRGWISGVGPARRARRISERGLLQGRRHAHLESGARLRAGLHPQAAAMGLDDRPRDVQPQARAADLGGEQAFEDLLTLVGIHARPTVLHRQVELALGAFGAHHQHAVALGRVAHRL